MKELILDDDFAIWDDLTKDELDTLKHNIKNEPGLIPPIVCWADDGKGGKTILDGRTRYKIARTLKINLPVVTRKFANKEAAIKFAFNAQRGRRNVPPGKLAAEYMKRFDANGEAAKQTVAATAQAAGVSKRTMERARTAAKRKSQPAKRKPKSGRERVSTPHRQEAIKAFGVLNRALDKLALADNEKIRAAMKVVYDAIKAK
jgi:hypothetical protein